MNGPDGDVHVDHDLAGDERPTSSSPSGTQLFPIGFGLGAVAALALFLGYRAVVPDGADTRADASSPSDALADPAAIVAAAGPLPDAERTATAGPEAAEIAEIANPGPEDDDPTADTDAYATATPDVAAAAPETIELPGFEELASLGGLAGGRDEAAGEPIAPASRLPSVDDPATIDLFGSPIMMVSSAVPRVVVLADGSSLVPGERLPGGHRLVDIHRERILLERDGVEWRVRIP